MKGACCPGKPKVTMLNIGGHSVGVSHLDEIIEEASSLNAGTEAELRATLLKKLKIYNYVPPDAEAEYAEAVWREFLERRKREDRDRGG